MTKTIDAQMQERIRLTSTLRLLTKSHEETREHLQDSLNRGALTYQQKYGVAFVPYYGEQGE